MYPSFQHDEYVLSFRLPTNAYRQGDVVIAEHQGFNTIIKRIKTINSGKLLLVGDNAASTSSEAMGWVPLENIKGKVIFRFSQSSGRKSKSKLFSLLRKI